MNERLQAFECISRNTERERHTTGAGNLGKQHWPIAIANLRRFEPRSWLDKFIASSEDRDTRRRNHLHSGTPDGGEDAELLWPQHAARRNDNFTLTHLVAAPEEVLFRLRRLIFDGDALPIKHTGAFDHHDGIGAQRQRSAGHDAGRLAGLKRTCRRAAGSDFLNDGKRGTSVGQVGATDGIAVHHCLVIGRRIDIAKDVLGDDEAEDIGRQRD